VKNRVIQVGITACLLGVFLAGQVNAAIRYRLEDFEKKGTKSGFGFMMVNDEGSLRPFIAASLSPDLPIGPIGIGFDAKLYIPMDGGTTPASLQSFTFRMLSYDHHDIFGVKWGRLTNETFGYGLLMDRYDSGSFGNYEFKTSKAGLKTYLQLKPVKVDVMYTATNVMAVRGSIAVADKLILGKPLIIGGTYITDSDGVYDLDTSGNVLMSPVISGYSVDVGSPVLDRLMMVFVEYATLLDDTYKPTGMEGGIRGYIGELFEYKAVYRILNARFIPGFFNSTYENYTRTNAFTFADNAPSTNISGTLLYAGLNLMEGYVKAGLEYALYENMEPSLTGALGWKQIGPTVGVMNYTKNFQDMTSAGMIEGSILYYDFPGIPFPADVVFHLKKIYGESFDDVRDESWALEIRPNLMKLFPNIPFLM
jgi:hypothetical protein